MANNITTRLTIEADGEELQRIKDAFKGENGAMDFERLIPMPKEEEENWYRWRLEHWGCKWNAYNIETSEEWLQHEPWDNEIFFDTPWSAPYPIYQRIAEMFPNIVFDVQFASEDIGQYSGAGTIRDGEVDICEPLAGSDDAYYIAFGCLPWAEGHYEKDENGEWSYHDEPV